MKASHVIFFLGIGGVTVFSTQAHGGACCPKESVLKKKQPPEKPTPPKESPPPKENK
jgi:hypothetical protein